MNIEQLLQQHRDDILRIATKHGARNVRVFGSMARGEATAESDLDLLVEDGKEPHHIAVLEIPPVESPRTAVRAAIVSKAQK